MLKRPIKAAEDLRCEDSGGAQLAGGKQQTRQGLSLACNLVQKEPSRQAEAQLHKLSRPAAQVHKVRGPGDDRCHACCAALTAASDSAFVQAACCSAACLAARSCSRARSDAGVHGSTNARYHGLASRAWAFSHDTEHPVGLAGKLALWPVCWPQQE